MATPAIPKTEVNFMPIIGHEDDKARQLPQDASTWIRFRHHPVTQRLTHVLVSLFIGAIILVLVNVTLVERNIRCATPEDCRQVRRLNTIVIGTRSILNVMIVTLLIFIILSQLGIDPRALIATAGVLGLVIGLGAQSFIKSFITGLQIIISGRFSIGDYVVFDLVSNKSATGTVIGFSLQSTTVQDFSGARYFVANGDILLVTNYSQNDQRAQVEVHVAFVNDIEVVLDHMRALCVEMAAAKELLDKVVRPPIVKGVTASGPSSYTIAVTAIVTPAAEFYVERYMRQRILSKMQALSIHASASVRLVKKVKEPDVKLERPKSTITAPPDSVHEHSPEDANTRAIMANEYPYTRARAPFLE